MFLCFTDCFPIYFPNQITPIEGLFIVLFSFIILGLYRLTIRVKLDQLTFTEDELRSRPLYQPKDILGLDSAKSEFQEDYLPDMPTSLKKSNWLKAVAFLLIVAIISTPPGFLI